MGAKITSAIIIQGRLHNEVKVTCDDSKSYETLFQYFPDELTFFQEEFLGMTRKEALELFHEKKGTRYWKDIIKIRVDKIYSYFFCINLDQFVS